MAETMMTDEPATTHAQEKIDRRKQIARKNYEIYQREIEMVHASTELISNDMDNNEDSLCLLILRKCKIIRSLRNKLTIQFINNDVIVDLSDKSKTELYTLLYDKCRMIEKLQKLMYRQLRDEQRSKKQLMAIRGWEQAAAEYAGNTTTTISC
jgi:hypothetical protein